MCKQQYKNNKLLLLLLLLLGGLFAFFGSGFASFEGKIVSVREKTLRNTNFVASRLIN